MMGALRFRRIRLKIAVGVPTSQDAAQGGCMSFQPFGYRFEIKSPVAPAAFKTAIRSRKKRWFEVKNGPRGWIVGPFICLWFSAFDRHGPMLFGTISDADFGTTVRGRAGSDLNGVAMFTLLIPFMAFLVFKMIEDGSASPRQLVVIAALILIGGPIIYWSSHKDRREAEPLIRFLNDTIGQSGRSLRAKSASVRVRDGFTLVSGEEERKNHPTSENVHDALLGLGPHDFAVLEAGPESYIQTAFRDGGYLLEKREGGPLRHFRASRPGGPPLSSGRLDGTAFTFEEVLAAFLAYGSGAPTPPFLKWEPFQLRQ